MYVQLNLKKAAGWISREPEGTVLMILRLAFYWKERSAYITGHVYGFV